MVIYNVALGIFAVAGVYFLAGAFAAKEGERAAYYILAAALLLSTALMVVYEI